MPTSIGWLTENDELLYKTPKINSASGLNNILIESNSTITGDVASGDSISNFEGTGLAIKRSITATNEGDFRMFVGGTYTFLEGGFGGTWVTSNVLVIKDSSKSTFAYYAPGSSNVSLFTGSHLSKVSTNDNTLQTFSDDLIGLIVSSTGNYSTLEPQQNNILENKYNAITINQSHPIVQLSNSTQDTTVFGIINSFENQNSTTRQFSTGGIFSTSLTKNINDRRVLINSLGEGGIWVCNANGNLSNGDYICSFKAGYGQKQDDDINHNYTVCKITCSCDFDENTDWNDENSSDTNKYRGKNITIDGTTYKAAFLGCIYLCG